MGTVVSYTLRCPRCTKKRQLQTGKFLEQTHQLIAKFFGLMYFWAHETRIKHAVEFTVLQNTAVQWYQYFQDICSWKMLAISIALGGPGNIVQIDESVMVRAKYHRGHRLCAQQRWVFGVYDPEKRPHRARRQSGGSDADPDYTTGCCAWHNNLVNEVGSLPYALTTRLHSPNGEPQTQFQRPRHRRVHQARGGILVQRETAF